MAYVTVPKDLTNVKTKILFNLTKRQLICFGSGAIVGIPVFFLLKNIMNTSSAAICMILVMLPFFMFAMYEKNSQPLEKIVGNIIHMYDHSFPLRFKAQKGYEIRVRHTAFKILC